MHCQFCVPEIVNVEVSLHLLHLFDALLILCANHHIKTLADYFQLHLCDALSVQWASGVLAPLPAGTSCICTMHCWFRVPLVHIVAMPFSQLHLSDALFVHCAHSSTSLSTDTWLLHLSDALFVHCASYD